MVTTIGTGKAATVVCGMVTPRPKTHSGHCEHCFDPGSRVVDESSLVSLDVWQMMAADVGSSTPAEALAAQSTSVPWRISAHAANQTSAVRKPDMNC